VQIGINDLHPLGALSRNKREILQALDSNIVAIRDALLARSDTVILTTIVPPGQVPWIRRFAWDPSTLQYVREANDVVRRSAAHERVRLLDAHAALADPAARLAEKFTDPDFFLHVNPAGYDRLNAELERIVGAARTQP
jgi:hypothetical protein